jgi:hypothetical protein
MRTVSPSTIETTVSRAAGVGLVGGDAGPGSEPQPAATATIVASAYRRTDHDLVIAIVFDRNCSGNAAGRPAPERQAAATRTN